MALADLLVHVGIDADDLESGIESAVSSVEDNIGKITAAGAVAGAGMEAFARNQAPLREQAARIGASVGEEAEGIAALAREASNVTFPLDEAFASMEVGRQQGLRSGKQLQEFATFWDTVGDATGESGPALAKAGVALRAVGIEAGNEAEALGALGFITEETTSSTSDFLNFLDRTGPELRGMGADVDDAAAIMGVLESELGMSGRTARTEFRSAINESDGTMQGLLDTLGVSADQFETYQGKVADSSDVIQRNADIHAESFTPMQKLQHHVTETMNRFSGFTDVAGDLALPLMALGPVSKGVTGSFRLMQAAASSTAVTWVKSQAKMVASYAKLAVKSLIHAAKVAASWLIAMGPIAIVIAAVVGLVALIVANWDKVKRFTRAAWDWVLDKIRGVWDWIKRITRTAVDSVVGFVRNLKDRAIGFVSGLVRWIRDNHPIMILWRMAQEWVPKVVDKVREIKDRVLGFFRGAKDWLFGAGKDVIQGLIDGAGSLLSSIGRFFLDKVPGWIRGPLEKALGISSPSKLAADIGRQIPRGLMAGMEGEASSLARAAERTALNALPDLSTPGMPRLGAFQPAAGLTGGNRYEVNAAGPTAQQIVQALRDDEWTRQRSVGV